MYCVLEYDDFCDQAPENCLSELESLVKLIPKIKVTMFTVPAMRGQAITDPNWIMRVRRLIESDNLRLAVHGCFHLQEEFDCKTELAQIRLDLAEECFKDANLPFIKVFKGPHWGANEHTHGLLKKNGYTHWYNHPEKEELEFRFDNECKAVHYNYNLAESVERLDFLLDDKNYVDDPLNTIVTHGHTHNVCNNGIAQTMNKVVYMDAKYDVEWRFADEI